MKRNSMLAVSLVACLVISLAVPAGGQQRQSAAKQSAVDTARAYAERMKEDAVAAIRENWDMDQLLHGIFGEALKQHTDAERAEMKKLISSVWEGAAADPAHKRALADAKIDGFEEAPGEQDTTVVSFDATFASGQVTHQSVKLKQVGGKWKVIDQATEGRWAAEGMRQQHQAKAGTVTPLESLKQMTRAAEERRKSRGQ